MSEPTHHSVYTILMQHGMPEGLDGEQQAMWVESWFQDQFRKRLLLKDAICNIITSAGNPNPAEGCRQIVQRGKEALGAK